MICPHCGCEIAKHKPRSVQQHRRFFGLVRAAFKHWPEAHERQFSTEEECRAWLTMKAGYRDTALDMPMSGVKPELAALIATSAMRAAKANAVAVAHKGRLLVFVPRSIAFHKMGPQEFGKLCDDVAAVITESVGMDADDLLRQTERAA